MTGDGMHDKRRQYYQERRMEVFRELVRITWNNGSKKELDSLAERMLASGRYKKSEEDILKKQIMVSAGLDPDKLSTELSADIDAAFNLRKVEKPLVTRADQQGRYNCQGHFNSNLRIGSPSDTRYGAKSAEGLHTGA